MIQDSVLAGCQEWEHFVTVIGSKSFFMYRLSTPRGWLVKIQAHSVITYVDDPSHEWQVKAVS